MSQTSAASFAWLRLRHKRRAVSKSTTIITLQEPVSSCQRQRAREDVVGLESERASDGVAMTTALRQGELGLMSCKRRNRGKCWCERKLLTLPRAAESSAHLFPSCPRGRAAWRSGVHGTSVGHVCLHGLTPGLALVNPGPSSSLLVASN